MEGGGTARMEHKHVLYEESRACLSDLKTMEIIDKLTKMCFRVSSFLKVLFFFSFIYLFIIILFLFLFYFYFSFSCFIEFFCILCFYVFMTELPEINVMMMMMMFVNILYVRTVRDSNCSESF